MLGTSLGTSTLASETQGQDSRPVQKAGTDRPQGRPKQALERERQKLRRKIDDLLRKELKTHWYPHAVNRERGGFHQSMARDWSLEPDENVFLVYQARMTWTAAAFAAYSPADRDEFVEYARHGIAFLDKVMRDQEFGGFHWILDPRGAARPERRRRKARLRHVVRRLRRQQGLLR